MSSDFRAAFSSKRYKFADDALEDRCANLAVRHDVAAEEMALEYERLMTVRSTPGSLVTEDDLEALELELERTKAKRAAKRPAPTSLGVLTDRTNRNVVTPHKAPPSALKTPPPSALPKTPSSAFHSRSQAGQVVKTLNEHLDLSSSKDAEPMEVVGRERCSIADMSSGPRPDQKFMTNRIADRVVYLERRMTGFAEALEQARGIPATHSLGSPCQEPEWFVGRVVCDSEGHLNASSALLEGTLQHSQGHSVKLDLSQLPSYRLFPGQVVAVRGRNLAGDSLRAQQLIASVPRPLSTTSPDTLRRFATATGPAGVSIVVAVGPFTLSEDLEYAPLAALLAVCRQRRPDVLALLGPFVDAEHPLLAEGAAELTFEEIFESQVLSKLRDFVEDSSCKVSIVLLPSTRDVHHDPVFPQPPFRSTLPPGIRALSNPATFSVNEVVIGAATADTLKQVAAQEIAQGPTQDRMGAIASSIIGQRSYYPLYPPPLGACLDTSLGQALDMPCTPDIMILPSDLAPMAKVVPCGTAPDEAASSAGSQETVCINPGRLVRDKSGATYAWLQVGALKQAETSTATPVPHNVHERCYVEIKRI